MINIFRHPVRLLLAACFVGVAAEAAAGQQEFVFAGIPWHTPADGVRATLEPRGFAFQGAIEHGDLTFSRRDGAVVRAEMQSGSAVGFLLVDTARGRRVDARYQALADSLAAALGKPDTIAQDFTLWQAGLSAMGVESYYRNGVHRVQLFWRGPGWFDEMDRRGRLPTIPAPPAGYTIVNANFISRVAVDTVTLARRADGTLRGRFRIDYVRPVGPEENQFDAAEYEMEMDCAGRRTRLMARKVYLGGQVRHAETHQRLPWEAPRPGEHPERGLDAVCRAAATLRR